ncbi:hypothetical protein KAI32_01985 [Candidatus Pacearchaeota archaeon]|nr:hypothetical protein [Candidatus Pacearchaeota archaeon]
MVKKKKGMMKKKKDEKKDDFWFRKSVDSKSVDWDWVPVNWKGGVSLFLLVGINVFAANYFQINELVMSSWSKFGVVFLVSLFVFIMIARRKTRGVKVKKY